MKPVVHAEQSRAAVMELKLTIYTCNGVYIYCAVKVPIRNCFPAAWVLPDSTHKTSLGAIRAVLPNHGVKS